MKVTVTAVAEYTEEQGELVPQRGFDVGGDRGVDARLSEGRDERLRPGRRAAVPLGQRHVRVHPDVPDLAGRRDLADDAGEALPHAVPSHRGDEGLVGIDAVQQRHDEGGRAEEGADPGADGGKVQEFHRDDHGVDGPGLGGIGGGGGVRAEVAAGGAEEEAVRADGVEVAPTRDQGDIVAGAGQDAPEVPADAPGTVDRDSHGGEVTATGDGLKSPSRSGPSTWHMGTGVPTPAGTPSNPPSNRAISQHSLNLSQSDRPTPAPSASIG